MLLQIVGFLGLLKELLKLRDAQVVVLGFG
jgi:hypothetical protein